MALPSGSNFDYSTTRHPKRTEETKPSGSDGRKNQQSVLSKRTSMETKVGTASKKMKPAVKRQLVSGKCHKSKLYNNTNDGNRTFSTRREEIIILSFSPCFCFNFQKFTSLKALEVPVRQVHPVAKGVFSRPESLKRASDGLQRNVSLFSKMLLFHLRSSIPK